MAQKLWSKVDRYYEDLLVKPDPRFGKILENSNKAGLPEISITANQGKFLEFLVRLQKARRVLEVGTLGGYSAAWIANGLPPEGQLICLEIDPDYAAVARKNLSRFDFNHLIDIRVGDATKTLKKLFEAQVAPFDLIFLDAEKSQYPEYLDRAIKLSHTGTLIVADNVVRDGDIIKPDSDDPSVIGIQKFNRRVAQDSRLSATVLQTVGFKGYDGFCLIYVNELD